MKKLVKSLAAVLGICIMLSSCGLAEQIKAEPSTVQGTITQSSFSLDDIPEYSGKPYVYINNNIPDFSKADYTTKSYESYGELDSLGRCTTCIANIGKDIMPTKERGSIGSVKPTGWQTVKYDNVDGKYLYNRCHLIGYQLTAENANPKNLITGTRYLNIEGMLPFEDEVAEYVNDTNNHVLYRVTPVFSNDNLVANGVQMEAYSVEDDGKGIEFNVYCYNVQPDITIDYATGKSRCNKTEDEFDNGEENKNYIVNTSSKKFHKPTCPYAEDIKEENRKAYIGKKSHLISNGYQPCKTCNP